MPVHVVGPGECMTSIGAQYNLDPDKLYQSPDNANLRDLRKNPNQLRAGDEVVIPEAIVPPKGFCTGSRHTFRVRRMHTKLRLRVQDGEARAVGDTEWKISANGGFEQSGKVDGDGFLEAHIPAHLAEATLELTPNPEEPDARQTFRLLFGHLDPPDTLTGVQARLNNLGYACGAVDDDEGPRTADALRQFRIDEGIDEDGPCGPKTMEALEERHGS